MLTVLLLQLDAQQQREEMQLRLSEQRNATNAAKMRNETIKSLMADLESQTDQLTATELQQQQDDDLDRQALAQIESANGNKTRYSTASDAESKAEQLAAFREQQLNRAEANLTASALVFQEASKVQIADKQRMDRIVDNRTGLSKQYMIDSRAVKQLQKKVSGTQDQIERMVEVSVHARVALVTGEQKVVAHHHALSAAEEEEDAARNAAEGSISQVENSNELRLVANNSDAEEEFVRGRITRLIEQKQQEERLLLAQNQELATAEKAVTAAHEEHAAAHKREEASVQAAQSARVSLSELQLKLEAAHKTPLAPLLEQQRMADRQAEALHQVNQLKQEEQLHKTEQEQAAARHTRTEKALIASTAQEHKETAQQLAAETVVKTAREQLALAEQEQHKAAAEARQQDEAVANAQLAKVL
jgi:hypothetical protein